MYPSGRPVWYYSTSILTRSDHLCRANVLSVQEEMPNLIWQDGKEGNEESAGREKMEQTMTSDRHPDRFNLS
jgi:hypothetical protein